MLLEPAGIKSVLFVCLGNICRSPMAEGVFRAHVVSAGFADRFKIASAGTGGWHVGAPPDERAIAAALARGIDISQQKARLFSVDDFQNFDLICAMDQENFAALEQGAAQAGFGQARISLLLDFAPDLAELNVPDPYYGGADGFENVLDLIEQASQGLIDQLTLSRR